MNHHPLWKEYFRFSRIERSGILILLLLSVVCFALPVSRPQYHPAVITQAPASLKEMKTFREPVKKKAAPGYVRKVYTIDINKADSAAWEALPGIGPVLAARIVRFRDKLGGFYSVAQVAETYGLPDSTFKKIQASLQLHKVSLKKIDINQTDEKTLAQHPYIRYKLARVIVLYRSNNGPFRLPEQLLELPLVDDSIYRKLEHYIKTENSPL